MKTSFGKNLYPFQISVNYPEAMHILQPIRNPSQLDDASVSLPRDRVTTYQLSAIHVSIPLDESIDVSVLHPFRNHREPVFTHRHPKQRQYIRMTEVLPGDSLSAESLWRFYPQERNDASGTLTLRMMSRSLVMYTRTTLMATRRPLNVPRDTLAYPPDSTSTESFEQSGMCMDFGITRCRLHVLQSLLNIFTRS